MYFFTVNLAERRGNTLLIDRIDHLRAAFRETLATYPVAGAGIALRFILAYGPTVLDRDVTPGGFVPGTVPNEPAILFR